MSGVVSVYPNPFTETTTIKFSMPEDDHVSIDVYDISGKLIETIFNSDVSAEQKYTVEFSGSTLPSGMYFYRMTTNSDVYSGKMMLLKE